MATKQKSFDCVEMKRKAQERLRKEYEQRKGEFESYLDFMKHKAERSDVGKALRRRQASKTSA